MPNICKAKVLVVEDDVHLLSGIRDILEIENYEVTTAHNGLEGLQILRDNLNNPPDIIVSDIMMPEMDGFEFLDKVREEDAWVAIPFIFLTAKNEKADRQLGTIKGADVYLPKPFEADELLITLDARLKRHENMRRVQDDAVSGIKKQILAILNHEFRTPLTLVVAYADMLRNTETENMSEDDLLTFLHGVNSGADRLRRLIENFIMLVELKSGDAVENYGWRKREIDNLDVILHDVRRQILSAEGVRSCAIKVDEDLPLFKADQEFLSGAIRELVHNAFKFSDPESDVEIRATSNNGMVEISVHDHGRGIPEEELDNVWETFYQYNRELYENQGAGTGLAIVREVVNLHNGECLVESELEKGSVFTIRLPISPKE